MKKMNNFLRILLSWAILFLTENYHILKFVVQSGSVLKNGVNVQTYGHIEMRFSSLVRLVRPSGTVMSTQRRLVAKYFVYFTH